MHEKMSSPLARALNTLSLVTADEVPSFWLNYVLLSAYTHLGCWKDTARRAVPQIDGSDPRIRGNYRARADAINKCYQVARQRKMVIFAVQHQGWCAAAGNLNGYRRYGKSNKCRNGKGGPWANDVYRITNPIRPALPKGIITDLRK